MTVQTTAAPSRPTGTPYPALVGVELRRLWWRRLTKVLIVASLLFTGVTLYGAYQSTAPDTIAQRIDAYRQTVAHFPEMVKDCEQAQAQARESGDTTADFGCSQLTAPTPAEFGLESPETGMLVASLSTTNSYLYAFLAFVLGASFIGAEFSSGSLGTWLTFEPRRLRVASSKLAAAGLGGAGLAALGLTLSALGAWLVSRVNQPDPALQLPPGAGAPESVTQLLLRCIAVSVLAGLAGVALGLIVRNTGAIVGIVLGYGVIVEGILAQALGHGRLVPWLPLKNLQAFVERGATYFAEVCGADGCQMQQMTVTYTHGWLYLLIAGVALLGGALLVFRRRDVG
jgi:ABC-2 type transport system permease protein